MTLKDHKLNNDHYMRQAFDPRHREKLIRAARLRRNVYIVMCFLGVACVVVAGFLEMPTLSCLSLFLATLSIVVVTKYDTQILFLNVIDKNEKSREKKSMPEE